MPAPGRHLRCLWLVRAFHYERDRLDNGWRQGARDPRAGVGDAAATLLAALDAWDAEAADQAVVDLAVARGTDAVLGVVRPYGLRCQANLGHKAIHMAAVESLLPRLEAPQRVSVLRALVRSFFIHGRSERARAFDESRRLMALSKESAPRPEHIETVADAMRRAEPGPAVRAMAGVAAGGVAWDAVLMQAAETTLAPLGVAPLHATTTAIAMAELARSHAATADGELARLQAAPFQALFRLAPAGSQPDSAPLTSLTATPWPAGDSLLARATHAAATPTIGALPGILALTLAERATLVQEFRRHMLTNATDLHHVKLAAGVLATLPFAGEKAGAALLAAALLHAPLPGAPDPSLQALHDLLDR